jgi:tetratricopeptide (TPR) repeat protein
LLSSQTVQASLGDLFRLQDDISRKVVDALSLPLTTRALSPSPDVPRNANAYALYLRGNEVSRTYDGLRLARDFYQRCLDLDPSFAPAWAHLGRCHRVIGKFIEGFPESEERAEECFRRALELNPRLTVAHKFYANLEADIGQAQRAVVRLLNEANRHGNDPELFAGLVHALRYCGLFEESLAAHAEAKRLDPNMHTSHEQTILMTGDTESILAIEMPQIIAGGDEGIRVIALGLAGRRDEARRELGAMRQAARIAIFQSWTNYLAAWLDRSLPEMEQNIAGLRRLKVMQDPEAIFQEGLLLCDIGEYEAGLSYMKRAVSKGYYPAQTLAVRTQFDDLRNDFGFQAIVADAEAGRARALAAFRETGGERLLGR